ncbi:hypothetical protein [Photobacterium leiognathi]|uniref:hypothetical protein n=1 Tax=Photobacterium leiognathi TaxID=553611 RepID=UPI00387F5312
MHRALYKELPLDEATAKAMIKATDLGTNIERLYEHKLYFRTKGNQGERLSCVDLNRIYQFIHCKYYFYSQRSYSYW